MAELFETLTGVTAAYRDLGDRGLLRLTGVDRVRFLNGMLSNDVSTLVPGETCYALQLNRKGRILADLIVLALEESLLLDLAVGTSTEVSQFLGRHIIADDVIFDDWSQDWGRLGLEGPGVGDALLKQGLPRPEPGRFERIQRDGREWLLLREGNLTPEGLQVLGPREALAGLPSDLGLEPLAEDAAEVLRIEAFLPAYGTDVSERNFPAEARLERAVSYSKGCFIGQEIVARIRSRGAVKRFLTQIRAEAPLEVGTTIRVDGTDVGRITSAAVSPVAGPVALGYVRAAEATLGTSLDLDGVAGVIVGPPTEP